MTSSKHEQLSMSWSGVMEWCYAFPGVRHVLELCWYIFGGKNKPFMIEIDLFMFG